MENDPSAVYSRTRKLVNCIEFQLQQLEEQEASQSLSRGGSTGVLSNAANSGPGGAGALADDDSMRRHAITENLNRLSAEVSLLERVVGEAYGGVAAASAKSDLWKKRLQQMQAEAVSLRATVMRYLQASFLQQKARQERETRHRLLENASGAQAVAVDSLLSERASLSHSSSLIDDYTSLAGNVLQSIKSQRSTLKSAHKKALDVATSLGLSSTLMRMIERRTTADKILVYGGMVFLLLLTGIMWWFLVKR